MYRSFSLLILSLLLFPQILRSATIEFRNGQKSLVEFVEDRTDSILVRQGERQYLIPLEDIQDLTQHDQDIQSAPVPARYLYDNPDRYREGRFGAFLFGGANGGPSSATYPYAYGAGLISEPHFSRFSFWGFGFSANAYTLPGRRSRLNAGSVFLYSYFDIQFSEMANFYAELGAGGTYLQWLPADGRRWVPAATVALGWQGLATESFRLRLNLRAYYAARTEFSRPLVPGGLELAFLYLY